MPISTLASACLVTSQPTYQQEQDCTTFFRADTAAPPFAQVARVDLTEGSPQFEPTIQLVACNADKPYVANAFLDGIQVGSFTIPQTGAATRTVDVVVPLLTSAPGCHVFELRASSEFVQGSQTDPATASDLGYAVWYLDLVDATSTSHPIENCPTP